MNVMQSELERTVEDNKKLTTQVDDLHKDIEKVRSSIIKKSNLNIKSINFV